MRQSNCNRSHHPFRTADALVAHCLDTEASDERCRVAAVPSIEQLEDRLCDLFADWQDRSEHGEDVTELVAAIKETRAQIAQLEAAPPALAPALADALHARGLTVEPKAIGGVWIQTVDLARDRLPCSDFAAGLIAADLAMRGLRLVGTDEAGWTYRTRQGVTCWVQGVV